MAMSDDPRPPAGPEAPGYTGPVPPGAGGAGAGASPVAPSAPPGAGRWVLAGWWHRVLAAVVDLLVIGAGAVAIVAGFGALFSVGFFASREVGIVTVIVGVLLGVVAFVIVGLIYAPAIMVATNGKTLGKMAAGIRVVRVNGQPMDWGTAALREVVLKILAPGIANSITAGVPLASAADLLWPLWDDENRALHDFPVSTRVIRG